MEGKKSSNKLLYNEGLLAYQLSITPF